MADLVKLQKHFFHPTARKLYHLIEKASPQDCIPDTSRLLEESVKFCNVCQTFTSRPMRFQVSMPDDNVCFNSELSLHMCGLEGRATLHEEDFATWYSNSAFLLGSTVEADLHTFVTLWPTVYPGYPNTMKVDQGGQCFHSLGTPSSSRGYRGKDLRGRDSQLSRCW